ncbi:hypothetical protein BaRGS_00008274 [Batillaria attramentaria]|uniref:LAGLIDADG homing endonuclease n=1 Tax=Batillaria attramentaria TaxID=370345 RepID=A0ABD0LMV3_9CAEN
MSSHTPCTAEFNDCSMTLLLTPKDLQGSTSKYGMLLLFLDADTDITWLAVQVRAQRPELIIQLKTEVTTHNYACMLRTTRHRPLLDVTMIRLRRAEVRQ